MKNIFKYLNNKDGFVYVVLIVVILGLGTIGLALAAANVSNIQAHQSIARAEGDYYSVDGAMEHVQAILERACAYGRYNAQKAADEAYQYGMSTGIPLTNDQLTEIFNNSFQYYILTDRGKNYISEQLSSMKDDPMYRVNVETLWNESQVDSDGIKLKINIDNILSKKKLNAVFNLPWNYNLDPQREIPIIRDVPVGDATMPIGYYNPIFRSPLTMCSTLRLNGSANLYVKAGIPGIALQWTNGLTSNLLNTDARVDIYGTTIPILESDNTQSLQGNSQRNNMFYVDGQKADQSIPCDTSTRFDLANYYDVNQMSQIITNKSDGINSYFEQADGDCILRIYTGDANIINSNAGNEWKSLSGKNGLIIIAGNLTTSSGFNVDSFNGEIVVLGNGGSRLDSSLKIIHNEDAILQAINLYRKATGSNTLELMFRLNTLMNTTKDPQEITIRTITGSPLLDSPLAIGNSYVSGNGLQPDGANPSFTIVGKKFIINNTVVGLQASMPNINFVSQNQGEFYNDGALIWNKSSKPPFTAKNIGEIYDYIDPALMQSWINSNVKSITREKSYGNTNYTLRIYTGDVTINNNGQIGNDKNIQRGLLFINGKLTIDGSFNYTGIVIATKGIYAYNGGNVEINYDPEVAMDALNTTPSAVDFFSKGGTYEEKTVSAYDQVLPSASVSDDSMSLFSSGVTISNVQFTSPYTYATIYGATSDITLSNSSLKIEAPASGKGLQSTTNSIFVSVGSNTQNSLTSDAVNTSVSGTYASLNKLGPVADMINVTELANWLSGPHDPLAASSGDIVLGAYTEGQNVDFTALNGKKGFLFYNGKLKIDSDFNFQGVVVATQGIDVTNGKVDIIYDKASAVAAAALNETAKKIFLNVPASNVASGSTYTGASNSGSISGNRGVTIVSWNTVK